MRDVSPGTMQAVGDGLDLIHAIGGESGLSVEVAEKFPVAVALANAMVHKMCDELELSERARDYIVRHQMSSFIYVLHTLDVENTPAEVGR